MTSLSTSIGIQRRLLGTEMRRLREIAGLLQEDAAEAIGKAANKISRLESGQVGVSKADLDVLLKLFKANDKDSLWCRELAKNSQPKRGKPTNETTLYLGPKWFRAFRDLEDGATEIMEFGSEIVTGLLQTENYIRAMFTAQGIDPTDKQMDDTLRIRAERRALLTKDEPPKFSFVLSESALRRKIGGREVMSEQLGYLAEVALLPNVTLQVIPFDAQSYAPMSCDFRVFRFGPHSINDIVYVELHTDAAYLDKPPELIRRYGALFGQLQGVALGPVESRNFIAGLADQFAAKPTPRG
jgi:transcriptional regulator with XRE-family HTH domain